MKGKKIFKRIVVIMLAFAVMCSNISVSAGSPSNENPTIMTDAEDTHEETDAAAVSDEASKDSVSLEAAEEASADSAEGEEASSAESDPAEDLSEDDPLEGDLEQTPSEKEDSDTPPEQPETPSAQPTEEGETPSAQPSQEGEMPDTPPEQLSEEENADPTPEDSEYEEEEPLDVEGLLSIEDLVALPDTETAANIWYKTAARPMLFALYGLEADEMDEEKSWTFDAYYINQNDAYDVTKTSDFSLKYQMEFHTSQSLPKGAVLIRIDEELYKDRNGNAVVPTEIAVPYGELDQWNANRATPFNYYYEDKEDGSGRYLVFFNYKTIPAGTNAAWQILYKNQRLMEIKDGTPWKLTPEISVDTGAQVPDQDHPDPDAPRGYEGADFDPRTSLTGRVDSSVSLTSVLLSAYNEPGKNYTPGLYTEAQLKRYINIGQYEALLNIYLDENGRLNTKKWRFVVWDMKIRGNATQPWDLLSLSTPTLQGDEDGSGMRVVGYKDHSDLSAYRLKVTPPDAGEVDEPDSKTPLLVNRTEESWSSRFYVVTAYPADRISPNTQVQNTLEITMIPSDGVDPVVVKTTTPAVWSYRDYSWVQNGDTLYIHKQNGIGSEDNTPYTGWLDAYRQASIKGEDYGDIPFSTTSTYYGYQDTHYTKTEGDHIAGEYIPGRYYTLTTADDFLYLYTDQATEGSCLMGKDDYYFSDVTITQTDYGYDLWEDERQSSDLGRVNRSDLPEDVFSADRWGWSMQSPVRIYAMLADPNGEYDEADDEGWTYITTEYINADNDPSRLTFRFSDDLLEQHPYRVKVEHDSIDYESTCRIDVKVRLRRISENSEVKGKQLMNQVLEGRSGIILDEAGSSLRLENLSGNMCHVHKENDVIFVGRSVPEGGGLNSDYAQYGTELQAKTQEYYGELTADNRHLLHRDHAMRMLTWMHGTAEANKEAVTTNDVDNNRVLVDYYLTAYDGYEIYDRSCLDYMKASDPNLELVSPHRTHVVFYDLLPYGVQYDASQKPTAGRITNLDSNGAYKTRPDTWSKTQVSVYVDPDEDIDSDYRGTGRTMVAFHVVFTGADATSYTDQKWIEGWGVSFRAYYNWKDISQINQVDVNSNLCAFMPDFSERAGGSNDSHPGLCGLKSQVEFDDGRTDSGKIDPETGKPERIPLETSFPVYEDIVKGKDGEDAGRGNIDGIAEIPGPDGSPVNGDKVYRNVLYASRMLNDDVTVSSTSRIETYVHAEADRLGTYDTIAAVPVSEAPVDPEKNGLYVYDNTVTVGGEKTGIVIFDRLEQAHEDRKAEALQDPFRPFEKRNWEGTFRSVDISGLLKQGIPENQITVYYHMDAGAEIPTGVTVPDAGWMTAKQWYTETGFKEALAEKGKEAENWQQFVRAVAVSLGDYVVPSGSSVSYRIWMQAPEYEELNSEIMYTYNNAYYSSRPANQEEAATSTEAGNSVRVQVSRMKKLEVIKRTSGNIPDALQDERFEFHIYEPYTYGSETEERDLAYAQYRFYKWDRVTKTWTEQRDQAYATDGDGYLYLHADERAVFELAGVGELKIEETKNVFWKTGIDEKFTKSVAGRRIGSGDYDTRTLTVTNVYRPVLYTQKNISSVPADAELDPDETFRFQLKTLENDGVTSHEVAGAEYWIVDSVRLDGGIPEKVESRWTEDDGTFELKAGEIAALFPGVAGTAYQLSEVVPKDTEEFTWDWYCANNTLTGKLPSGGDSRMITNYYRWKDLLLTKEITHQTKEDYDNNGNGQLFTFRLAEAAVDSNGKLLTDPDGNLVPKMDGENYTTSGLKWVLLEEGTEKESDTIGIDGIFTCAAGYRTVKIERLEAGKTYILTELKNGIPEVDGRALYVPNNDTAEVKMPVYSTKNEVTITNDYQKRSLSVTKTVVGADESSASAESYEFTVEITRGTKQVPVGGVSYRVTKEGAEDRELTLNAEGKFRLSDGETAVFKEIGMLGDRFEVIESQGEGVNQIYPENHGPAEGMLSGDGGEASFINGAAGSLMISKTYLGTDEKGQDLVSAWKTKREDGSSSSDSMPSSSVEYTLKVWENGTVRKTRIYAECVDSLKQSDDEDKITQCWITPGEKFSLEPWQTMVILTEGGQGLAKDAVYMLEEAEPHRIVRWQPEGDSSERWMQISQSASSEALLTQRSVLERPVASISNEVWELTEGFRGSRIGKWMTPGSDEVPEGAELVWRVEKYDAPSGRWLPAKGIQYAVFALAGDPISGRIQTTGTDGKIPMVKPEAQNLEVRFQTETVYVNLNQPTEIKENPGADDVFLRLVEVPEESDREWGLLAGYACRETAEGAGRSKAPRERGQAADLPAEVDAYALTVSPTAAIGFVNSNAEEPLEIEKQMSVNSDAPFRMILRQILSVSQIPVEKEADILADRPGAGITYKVYGADGEVRSGVTGTDGGIELYAGEYAVLNVPEGTKWTVSEQISRTPTYQPAKPVEAGPGAGGSRLAQLNDNLMLVDLPAALRYRLTFDDNGGYGGPGILSQALKEVPEGGVAFTIPNTEPETKEPGCFFLGWSAVQDPDAEIPEEELYKKGDTYTLPEGQTNATLYAVWESCKYMVTYISKTNDGKQSEADVQYVMDDGDWVTTLTQDQLEDALTKKGLEVPTYDTNNGPSKYVLFGWSETKNSSQREYKPGADIIPINDMTLYAVWIEGLKVSYTDGVNGVTVFPDQSYEGLKNGDSTPAFVGTPTRNGYNFIGWSPTVNSVVALDDADDDGEIIYTATWEEIDPVDPVDPSPVGPDPVGPSPVDPSPVDPSPVDPTP